MSVWPDIRVVGDFTCVTVPEEIDYPLAKYITFKERNLYLGKLESYVRSGWANLKKNSIEKSLCLTGGSQRKTLS